MSGIQQALFFVGMLAVAAVWKPLKWAHDLLLPHAIRFGIHQEAQD
jgi:hypothetical protein